jgi:hypothetical protein
LCQTDQRQELYICIAVMPKQPARQFGLSVGGRLKIPCEIMMAEEPRWTKKGGFKLP